MEFVKSVDLREIVSVRKMIYAPNVMKILDNVKFVNSHVAHFKGFHYFNPEDFSSYEESKYLVAYLIQQNKIFIVGVVKYSVYGSEYQYQG